MKRPDLMCPAMDGAKCQGEKCMWFIHSTCAINVIAISLLKGGVSGGAKKESGNGENNSASGSEAKKN